MQFKVPQFLDIEDKIFGPFTFKEFTYLAGGAGLCFVLYKLLGFILGFLPMAAVALFSLTLTFYRPNNKPFVEMLQSFFKYTTQSKLYIWKRRVNKNGMREGSKVVDKEGNEFNNKVEARLNRSKLRDLAWSLDVLDTNKRKNTGT